MTAQKVSGPNVALLREAVKQIPKCKQIMEYFADTRAESGKTGQGRAREESSFPMLLRRAEGPSVIKEEDLHRIFDALQQAKAGVKVRHKNRKTGEQTYYKFVWAANLIDVATAALGRKLPAGQFRPPVHWIGKLGNWEGAHWEKLQSLVKQLDVPIAEAVRLNIRRTEAARANPAPAAVEVSAPRAGFIVVRSQYDGRPAELEIDLSRVPASAYRSIKYLD